MSNGRFVSDVAEDPCTTGSGSMTVVGIGFLLSNTVIVKPPKRRKRCGKDAAGGQGARCSVPGARLRHRPDLSCRSRAPGTEHRAPCPPAASFPRLFGGFTIHLAICSRSPDHST